MRRLGRIFFLLLSLILVFALSACGDNGDETACIECVDEDRNGKCDTCGKDVEVEEEIKDILLFENNEPTFQIILADGVAAEAKMPSTP